MPRVVDEIIGPVGGAKYISTLDLTKYQQVSVRKNDWQKMAFTASLGLFQFKRMPLGMQVVPATFQRMVDKLLDGLGEFVRAYIDDVVIYSCTWEGHTPQPSSTGL